MKLQNLLFYVPYSPTVRRISDGYTFTLDMQNAYVMEREGLRLYQLDLKPLRDIPREGVKGLTYQEGRFYYHGVWKASSAHMLPMFLFVALIEKHYDVFGLNL
jgi:hypothetical protein